jgi:hypothetical protein
MGRKQTLINEFWGSAFEKLSQMDTAHSEIQEFPPNNQVISSKGDTQNCYLGVSVRHIAATRGSGSTA